jgi:hypothetical protein
MTRYWPAIGRIEFRTAGRKEHGVAVHVRARRVHGTLHGAVTVHIHQFDNSTMFGFDIYSGDSIDVARLHPDSSPISQTLEGAQAAVDAAVMEEVAAETTVVRGKGRAMSTHERFVGLYENDIQTTRIERLSDNYEHAAKVTRLVRRAPGSEPVTISGLQKFGETWGATEDEALRKIEDLVTAWACADAGWT